MRSPAPAPAPGPGPGPAVFDHAIEDEQALEHALGAPLYLLFKHSPICPTSDRARYEVRRFLPEAPENGWIDVISGRPLSREVERRTGVTHQSPQALLLAHGRVIWHASHGAITRDALAAACREAQSGR